MRTLLEHEAKALEIAGAEAGEYLEELNQMSLDKLSETQWNEFLKIIVTTFQTKSAEILGKEIPF